MTMETTINIHIYIHIYCDLYVTCPPWCYLDVTACQVLHSQHVPWPYGTKALRWVGCGFPWCRTPKPLPRAIPGRKILAELRISFGEKTGIFLLHFSWWDHFISLQSGIVDSWATSGKGRNPFHTGSGATWCSGYFTVLTCWLWIFSIFLAVAERVWSRG